MTTLSWRDARAELATVLNGLTITEPIATSIKRVFATPPAKASDFPCVVILGAEKSVSRASGLRNRTHIAHLLLVVRDADLIRSADILDALQDAITTAIDDSVTLNQKLNNVVGPEWLLPDLATSAGGGVGGQKQQAVEGILTFTLYDAPGFSA